MAFFSKGDRVWVPKGSTDKFDVAIGAIVKSVDGFGILLVDDENEEHFLTGSSLTDVQPIHPSCVLGVDDMIQLGELSEAAILRNLFIRYYNHTIYTHIGTVLVAINPYQLYPIYDAKHIHMYSTQTEHSTLPPHIFSTAQHAYNSMKRQLQNQSIIISGESGAGKTESTKLMLRYLTAVSGQQTTLDQQILDANPILEAFGNAKTVRNDNSSRFGKYINVHFNRAAIIEGAKIEQYLLEKSRIVHQMPDERNYHIFYRLLAGLTATEKSKLHLTTAGDYYYLSQGNCLTCDGMDDKQEFSDILRAMKVLMFSDEESWILFTLLAAILHLGNISFNALIQENMEACSIVNGNSVKSAAHLLQIPDERLHEAFTSRSTYASGELIYSPIPAESARHIRDAFVKGIYSRLFIWIVNKINSSITKPLVQSEGRMSLGVLDIFGFENFAVNSFEQLCINYANEKLHNFFVDHVFKMEQAEYRREGLDWTPVAFFDNQEVVDTLAQKPMNCFSLMDEESRFPQGSDETFLEKLKSHHGKSSCFVKFKSRSVATFGVVHFAGTIQYDVRGILDKNRDTFSADLVGLICESKIEFLFNMFAKEMSMGEETRKRSPTLSAQFRRSLDVLMKMLLSCEPSFVRCIKPNEHKKPMNFDRFLCWQQLKYSGMLETVKIRKSGFAIRYTFQEFVNRYRVIIKEHKIQGVDPQGLTEALAKASLDDFEWTIGNRMIFLKDHHGEILERARDSLLTGAVVILQRTLKRFLRHRKQQRQTCAAVLIQKTWRGYRERKMWKKILRGISRLQATFKAKFLSAKFESHRENKRLERERLENEEREREILERERKRMENERFERKRLERERRQLELEQKERESKLQQAQREAEARITEMFGFSAREEQKPNHQERRQNSGDAARGSSFSQFSVDDIRKLQQLNTAGLWNYTLSQASTARSSLHTGQTGLSSWSGIKVGLMALIIGFALQGSNSEPSSDDSRRGQTGSSRNPGFVSPLRSPPKGPQGSPRWRSDQS